jgi:putative aldouronate transport system substrate-binding protein
MKKRVLAILLTVAMVTAMLAGCGNGNSASSEKGENTETTQKDKGSDNAATADKAAAGEKVKLKALYIAHPLTKDVEEMKWLQEMEDEAGVDVEWEVIRADWETVKSTRFAAGDIPDILFNATIDSDYTKYNGLFLELTPYISSEKTPNIQAMFEEEPETKVLSTTLEGKIYGTPKFQGKWPSTNTVMFINKDWLDKLGLKVPTTYTEFKNVLTAFKDQDANGNGDPNDEIPLDYNAYGGNNAWFNSAYSLTNLLGSMGIQLTNWGVDAYFAEDSKVKCYAIDERYKLWMKYIADLYANGLINPNAITNDYSAFQSLSRGDENGNAIVGCVFGWEETDKFGPELYKQYVPVPALDYDIDSKPGTYDTRWRDDYTGLNMSSNRSCISAKCENPEAAMAFIDRFYDKTHSVEALFGGVTDGCIEVTGDNSYKVLPPLDPNTDPGTWKWTSTFADAGPMYIRRASTIEMAQDMTFALKERETYNDVIAKASVSDTYPQMFMKYTEEDQNTMALTQANINNIIDNQWSLWMTGDQDIDSTWDAYVESVNNSGLAQIIEIRQKAFDEYLKSVK